MITTGAAPAAAIMMEQIKNHPGLAAAQAGMGIMQLPPTLSCLVLSGLSKDTAAGDLAQKQYDSNVKSAVSAQNHWNQMAGDGDGKK